MHRATRLIPAALGLALLAACGGEKTPADGAAQACDAEVKQQSRGKPYQLDAKLLAESMRDAGGGTHLLTAPVVVNAGLADQSTQQLECSVRLTEAGAEVLNLRFIW